MSERSLGSMWVVWAAHAVFVPLYVVAGHGGDGGGGFWASMVPQLAIALPCAVAALFVTSVMRGRTTWSWACFARWQLAEIPGLLGAIALRSGVVPTVAWVDWAVSAVLFLVLVPRRSEALRRGL